MVMKIKEVPPRDDQPEPEPPFGEWLECRDGKAHYFLGGACLCEARARVVGAAEFKVYPDRGPGKRFARSSAEVFTVPQCAACVAANVERWAAVPAKPPGVA